MRISVMIPFMPLETSRVVPYAEMVADGTAHALWQAQSVSIEGSTTFAALAGMGIRVRTGIGVGLMPLCHPYLAAVRARGLASTTGQSVVAGFGPAATVTQTRLLGAPYHSQLTAIREYVTIVRSLLESGQSAFEGEYFTCQSALPPMETPQIEIGLGVLRSRMAALAGEIADVAITWITPASYIENVLRPILRSGTRSPRIVAMVPAALEQNGLAGRDVALAGNFGHLSLPHYQAMLRDAGGEIDPSDPAQNAEELIRLGGFLHGDESSIAEGIRRYRDAGVDELVLNCTAMAELHGVARAVRQTSKLLEIANHTQQEMELLR